MDVLCCLYFYTCYFHILLFRNATGLHVGSTVHVPAAENQILSLVLSIQVPLQFFPLPPQLMEQIVHLNIKNTSTQTSFFLSNNSEQIIL